MSLTLHLGVSEMDCIGLMVIRRNDRYGTITFEWLTRDAVRAVPQAGCDPWHDFYSGGFRSKSRFVVMVNICVVRHETTIHFFG